MVRPIRLAAMAALAILLATPLAAREVSDAMGTVTVPDLPERIVVLTNEGTEALLALGVHPVGAVNSWQGDPWWDHIEAQMGDAEPAERLLRAFGDLRLGNAARLQPQFDIVLKDRQDDLVLRRLEHKACVRHHRLRFGNSIAAVDRDSAGRGLGQAVDQPRERGLAGTVEADHADPAAGQRQRQRMKRRAAFMRYAGFGEFDLQDYAPGKDRIFIAIEFRF